MVRLRKYPINFGAASETESQNIVFKKGTCYFGTLL